MLVLLHHEIMSNLKKMFQGFHIEDVDLTDKLVQLLVSEADDTTYRTSQAWCWIHELEQDLIDEGQVLLTICHLSPNNKHWIVLRVNGRLKKLAYGNSFRNDIPNKILAAYQSWFSRHSSTFIVKQLPIPKQVNLVSCGILAKVVLEDAILDQISESQGFDAQAA